MICDLCVNSILSFLTGYLKEMLFFIFSFAQYKPGVCSFWWHFNSIQVISQKSWSSGATECRVWIGNCNIKFTEHKLHKTWRSTQFKQNEQTPVCIPEDAYCPLVDHLSPEEGGSAFWGGSAFGGGGGGLPSQEGLPPGGALPSEGGLPSKGGGLPFMCLPPGQGVLGRQTTLWTDKHLWKHYLLATSLADGNEPSWI